MIKIIKSIDEIKKRSNEIPQEVEETTKNLIAEVRRDGDAALFRHVEQFDKAKLGSLEVANEEIEQSLSNMDKDFYKTINRAMDHIEGFHKNQIQQGFTHQRDGVVLGQKVTPIERVGIYVPGGKAVYPSTVLMNVIPAKLAGVKHITLVSPPKSDGTIDQSILACAFLAGVDKLYKIGGASAVAALTYGTETVEKVYKITGPGNIYVAAAKKQVYGDVGIDMIAGPSEILIIADETANPKIVAGDLLSQAEHDSMASAILLTTSDTLAQAVQKELENQIATLSRGDICRRSIDDNSYIMLCPTLEKAIEYANDIAPEHLELMLDQPFDYLGQVKNAGSIFLGKNTPEALGDYFAGVNHTLPTNSTAKFSSALSVDTFVKKSTFVYYSEATLEKEKDDILLFAKKEGLEAHGQSVANRFE
ncbi:MAG: histidinol dehydrogenase [Eubacteriales bacterium]